MYANSYFAASSINYFSKPLSIALLMEKEETYLLSPSTKDNVYTSLSGLAFVMHRLKTILY